MKEQSGVNYCPKCGRQRVGDQEYDEERRVMVFACDVDGVFIPHRILGDDPSKAPHIRVTPAKMRSFSGRLLS